MSSFNLQARKKARRLALQALYQWQMSQESLDEIQRQFHNQHHMSKVDVDYFHELLFKIPERLTEVDNLFNEYLDRKLSDLSPIELTVLRMGAYELAFREDVPYKVVINEAVELTKTFGAEASHKYINGVLDKVAKQLR